MRNNEGTNERLDGLLGRLSEALRQEARGNMPPARTQAHARSARPMPAKRRATGVLIAALALTLAVASGVAAVTHLTTDRMTMEPKEHYRVDENGRTVSVDSLATHGQLRKGKRVTYEGKPEPLAFHAAEAAAEALDIPVSALAYVPAGFDREGAEYIVHFYDAFPDHYRLEYPALKAGDPSIYALVEHVGPYATFDLKTMDAVEVVTIHGVEAMMRYRDVDGGPCYYFFLMEGDYFMRMTVPVDDRAEAIRVMESFAVVAQ